MELQTGRSTALYRVILQVVIKKSPHQVYCVHDDGGWWELPKTPIAYGQSAEAAAHKIVAHIVQPKPAQKPRFTHLGAVSLYDMANKQHLMIMLVEAIVPKKELARIETGNDAAWIDPRSLKTERPRSSRIIYKFCVDSTAPIEYVKTGQTIGWGQGPF